MESPKTVAIAGATGFVGLSLVRLLGPAYRLIGLTRGWMPQEKGCPVEWRKCDLFSLLQSERALEGVDTAFYLVHSMLPSARLTQGKFQDMDLIIADNFARAAAKNGVKQIVYLGGLIPDDAELSPHLKSRWEVEMTLGSHGVPVTALRAGIVVGLEGSSFSMLRTVVQRLPVVPCPLWARSLTQPIALDDVLLLLRYCLENPAGTNRFFDVGSPDVMTYRELLERTAQALGLKRRFVNLPFTGATLCQRVLPLVTGAHSSLVRPLIESMRHSMTAKDRRLQQLAGLPGVPFEQAVRSQIEKGPVRLYSVFRKKPRSFELKGVRSVQRIPLPPGRSARWVAEQYPAWLAKFFRNFIVVEVDEARNARLMWRFPRVLLLELSFAQERSSSTDRQLLYITGGILARPRLGEQQRPRLEFREALGGTCTLVAIHDYFPTLPWPLYNCTQALAHAFVMRHFSRHIVKLGEKECAKMGVI